MLYLGSYPVAGRLRVSHVDGSYPLASSFGEDPLDALVLGSKKARADRYRFCRFAAWIGDSSPAHEIFINLLNSGIQ